MINLQFPTARKSGLVVQEMPEEVLVYDLDKNKAHCLNQSAASVWKLCDGKRSASEIASLYGADCGKLVNEDIVWLALDQLNESNLLESEIETKFAGESRRSVIKKIGLASVVALPIIASMMAPQNAMASASCECTSNQTCGTLSTCPTMCCNFTDSVCNQPPLPTGACPSA
ncbi:MAG: PqqD family protein [Pyrinomonadaceae bacterium]